jgi:hypothetical protein
MILVIHDNMINETNNIVLHVFVAFLIPMMRKYHMLKWEDSVYFEGLNRARKRKENKRQRRMNRRYQERKRRCNGLSNWYTEWRLELTDDHQMNRRSKFYMRQMNGRVEAAEVNSTGWTDGPLVGTVGLTDDPLE